MQKLSWEDIDKLLTEAEETNVIYDVKDINTVPESGRGGMTVLTKLPSDGGQTIPEIRTSVSDGGQTIPEVRRTSVSDGGQTAPELRKNMIQKTEMSTTTKRNLMYFAAGLGLFLILRKK
jgi:hypothetical protein